MSSMKALNYDLIDDYLFEVLIFRWEIPFYI